MNAVKIENVTKTFGHVTAVKDLSLQVPQGSIYGFIGPNGSGKTTTMKMIINIYYPDQGTIRVFDQIKTGSGNPYIGYLPEERGLYRRLTVIDSLIYLGALKNYQNKKMALELLERMEMLRHKDKKLSELSKGMQQKIQLIAAICHDPHLIILDEPFSGLDPVNMKLVKEMILELGKEGKTILISTHMMDQVERMCGRIFMIHRGGGVLYGSVAEIKSRFGKNTVFLEFEGELKNIPGVKKSNLSGNYAELILEEGADTQDVLKAIARDVRVGRFEVSSPSLNEIFIKVVEE